MSSNNVYRYHYIFQGILKFNFRLKVRYGDSEVGRLRLHQTADIVVLFLNNPMGDSEPGIVVNGICQHDLFAPERPKYLPVILLHAHYGKSSL